MGDGADGCSPCAVYVNASSSATREKAMMAAMYVYESIKRGRRRACDTSRWLAACTRYLVPGARMASVG